MIKVQQKGRKSAQELSPSRFSSKLTYNFIIKELVRNQFPIYTLILCTFSHSSKTFKMFPKNKKEKRTNKNVTGKVAKIQEQQKIARRLSQYLLSLSFCAKGISKCYAMCNMIQSSDISKYCSYHYWPINAMFIGFLWLLNAR